MKLEIGMYVKTVYGIKKVISIICGQDVKFDNTNGFDEDLKKHHDYDGISKNDNYFWKNEVIREPSFNLIDLIEVGDYVNGLYVAEKFYDYENEVWEIVLSTTEHIKFYKNQNNIKTILTKEQFENNCYKIGE